MQRQLNLESQGLHSEGQERRNEMEAIVQKKVSAKGELQNAERA